MAVSHVPAAGEIVWLQFNPRAGHEQAGHRPAVVLSPAGYNAATGLMVCCPVTTKIKGYPFEVEIMGQPASAALADQVKSLDWQVRNAQPKGRVRQAELDAIRGKIAALIGC
jgi:mRNA interferase MazF